jgi:hypothetical protein
MWGRNARFKAKLAASLDGESESEEKLKKESLLSEPTVPVPVPVPPRSRNGAENSQIYKRKRVREHQVSASIVSSRFFAISPFRHSFGPRLKGCGM